MSAPCVTSSYLYLSEWPQPFPASSKRNSILAPQERFSQTRGPCGARLRRRDISETGRLMCPREPIRAWWLSAIIGILVAAAVYLSRAPAHRYDIYLYLVAAAVGCGFRALATAATGVERDLGAGRLYTRCGPAFAATWAIAIGTRVAFIWALLHAPRFAHTAGPFIRDHQIGRNAIAAAFVLMAVTMYGLRFAVIAVRARYLRAVTAPVVSRGPLGPAGSQEI
jgi:hypothetical protein